MKPFKGRGFIQGLTERGILILSGKKHHSLDERHRVVSCLRALKKEASAFSQVESGIVKIDCDFTVPAFTLL